MDYEKKYKEALERAQQAVDKGQVSQNFVDDIFPEHKGSEDEKTQKELIAFLEENLYLGYADETWDSKGLKRWLAWVEKQGEKKHIINVPPREVILSIWDLGNEWKKRTNGSISTEYGTQLEYIQKHWHESEYYLKEKQGKQTQLDYEHADIPQKDFAPIEPKFKVGDFITNDYCLGKVIEITNDAYLLDTGQGIPFSCEHNAHLWTIEDAKDGDILCAKGGYFKEYVFKFSSFTEDNVISTHFGYDVFHRTFDTKLSRFGREEDFVFVNPATKEQRDLLFSKMKEAGYEWDAEKKELKKIEVASKESKDERIRKAIHIYLDWLDGRKDYAPKGSYSIKDMIAWLEKQTNKD